MGVPGGPQMITGQFIFHLYSLRVKIALILHAFSLLHDKLGVLEIKGVFGVHAFLLRNLLQIL